MENMGVPTRRITTQKVSLIAGIITLLLSVCVIFPIESSKTYFLAELDYTFLTLGIALLLLLFGLLGRNFFKGLLFVFLSAIAGFISFYLAYMELPLNTLAAFWVGIPSGIIAALVFMVANFFFIRGVKSYKLPIQIIAYLVILLIVCILFAYGGDWLFEITQYFENN